MPQSQQLARRNSITESTELYLEYGRGNIGLNADMKSVYEVPSECFKEGTQTRSIGKLKQHITGEPCERVTLNILESFSDTASRNKYLKVDMDNFSK